MPFDSARYLPTPDEIQCECAKIRATWNESVRKSREAVHAIPWSLPDFHGIDLMAGQKHSETASDLA